MGLDIARQMKAAWAVYIGELLIAGRWEPIIDYFVRLVVEIKVPADADPRSLAKK